MPRCRNAAWCIDDMCHFTSQTLCGLWVAEDIDDSGEWAEDDEFDEDEAYEMYGPDDDEFVARPALARTHNPGNRAP